MFTVFDVYERSQPYLWKKQLNRISRLQWHWLGRWQGWLPLNHGYAFVLGYVFVLVGGSVAWATQKQRIIALSSTEVKYMALTEFSKHAKWMLSLLEQLHFMVDLPINIFSDSLGARSIASNNVFHKRMKHIYIKHHYVWEKIADGTLAINEVNTKDNLADILTKALPRDQRSKLAVRLGLVADLFAGSVVKTSSPNEPSPRRINPTVFSRHPLLLFLTETLFFIPRILCHIKDRSSPRASVVYLNSRAI